LPRGLKGGGRWANLSVTAQVRERLERLREELGMSSNNDVIVLLLRAYEEREDLLRSLHRRLDAIEEALRRRP